MQVIVIVFLIIGISLGIFLTVSADENLVPSWIKNTALYYGQGNTSDIEFLNALKFLLENNILIVESDLSECLGTAACIPGKVTKIVDGDTIEVYGKPVRFSLASAPERNESGGSEATEFVRSICPVGSSVVVDEDDRQTQGSYGRIIAVIHCNGMNLNESILENDHAYIISSFCNDSEFGNSKWAKKHGC
ncbi:MAG: thermonuclease family protein [Nitrosopumilus sp.]|nr:thermonuclease family protein [Nitrosopumilus sp.]